jgi:predicted transcriptional regulator
VLQEIQDCKQKVTTVLDILRKNQGKIDNTQIATLNDLAYKAVQKKGNQKKLDERALKN